MNEETMPCDEKQVEICGLKMESILSSLSEVKMEAKAVGLLASGHHDLLMRKFDELVEVITGGGRAGTGLSPRLTVNEVKTARLEVSIERLNDKLEKYIEAKAADERKLYRGILAALGTAVLSMLSQLAMFLVQHMAGRGTP
jgi:hypothetical protein